MDSRLLASSTRDMDLRQSRVSSALPALVRQNLPDRQRILDLFALIAQCRVAGLLALPGIERGCDIEQHPTRKQVKSKPIQRRRRDNSQLYCDLSKLQRSRTARTTHTRFLIIGSRTQPATGYKTSIIGLSATKLPGPCELLVPFYTTMNRCRPR